MADSCPLMTKKDKELQENFQSEIQFLNDNKESFVEALTTCSRRGGGKKRYTGGANKMLVKAITRMITMAAAGATTAFFLQVLPMEYQTFLASIATGQTALPVCQTTYDYTMGAMAGTLYTGLSCAEKARLLELGINRIMYVVSGALGIGGIYLEQRVEELLDGNTAKGGKKSKRTRKTKKSRKARKAKKSRKGRK